MEDSLQDLRPLQHGFDLKAASGCTALSVGCEPTGMQALQASQDSSTGTLSWRNCHGQTT